MEATLAKNTYANAWLRNPGFDLMFIVGLAVIAIASGFIVVARPELFGFILFLDLWLLGYHHVISTYTRLCFDKESFKEHRFVLFVLPILVFTCVAGLGIGVGLWTITSIYLYWQWFHYTRQSWGISQGYRRKTGEKLNENELLLKATFYLLPLWGILYRSWQAPDKFIGAELVVIPTPEWLVDIVGLLAVGTILVWGFQRFRSHQQGKLIGVHTLYMISHFSVFYVGYVYIEDITYGWLTINIWHNAQYILFVWLFNNKRYQKGIDPKARFLSRISQNKNRWLYMVICLSLTTVVYSSIDSLQNVIYAIGIPSLVLVYQSLNFHHYIVDSIIWKMRKPQMKKTLGLS
ncbi:MAG: hypothetical protein HOJ34_01825 [Kordiimonadaceae bacterium]|jgi:hypothetical protein|nr:hypothetical protein [Kordiimonadaceae bacterium]MBT6035334.1 hypothetical protein [Kordiimonadaceae bacterium]MBT6328495.1 hypothetical protein [Kordiimonadaceae bacterium]MBT7581958.1 hypothetical protein [Kordiimonadaceae bacterium]